MLIFRGSFWGLKSDILKECSNPSIDFRLRLVPTPIFTKKNWLSLNIRWLFRFDGILRVKEGFCTRISCLKTVVTVPAQNPGISTLVVLRSQKTVSFQSQNPPKKSPIILQRENGECNPLRKPCRFTCLSG